MGVQITKKGGRTVAVPEKLARALVRSGRFAYTTRELTLEPAPEPEPEREEETQPVSKPKRVYKRRDMKAED